MFECVLVWHKVVISLPKIHNHMFAICVALWLIVEVMGQMTGRRN